jgi:hypothetical protein
MISRVFNLMMAKPLTFNLQTFPKQQTFFRFATFTDKMQKRQI